MKHMIGFYDFLSEGDDTEKTKADVLESAERIQRLMQNGDNFGIITAYRAWLDDETNEKAQTRLEAEIMKLTDGYIPFHAGYSYVDKEGATKIELPLLFVPNIELKALCDMGKTFVQDTVIFGNKSGVDSYSVDGQKEISLTMPDAMFAFCTVMFNPGTFKTNPWQ